MNKKKRNTIITCVIVGIILLSGFIFFLLNHSVVDNGMSVLEKKWIADHSNLVVDVRVCNDIPVFGYNGSGVSLDFLDYFTEKYKVSFNKISYFSNQDNNDIDFGFTVLDSDDKLSDSDILFYTDHYAIISKKGDSISLGNVSRLGALKSDEEIIKKYFKDIEFVFYDDISGLVKGIADDEVAYGSVPILQYMDKILENNLNIVFHIDDLKKRYVLRVKDKLVYDIMNKSYNDYLIKDYKEDYSKNYLNVYFNATKSDDYARKNYNSKIYHYGYVVNMPFENVSDDGFVGTISNYLTNFEEVAFSEIDVKKYDSVDDLKSALVSGDVDFALSNFDYKKLNLEYVVSDAVRDVDYLVLSKKLMNINSIQGLRGEKVSVVSGSLLSNLCTNEGIDINGFKDTDDLIRNVDDNSIILMDRETYLYYKNSKLKNYYVVLDGTISDGYRFVMNSGNEFFNKLFQFYVSSVSYHDFMYKYNTDILLDKNYTVLKITLFIVCFVLFLVSTIWFMSRKSVTKSVSKKDDKLKYIDPMTSLKNRNYLNKNIYAWDDNVIFPQGIVVFDLDHIKRVNDKFGREAGDEIIRKVASILINNQVENTDIIRSDGDEFIVYMVGYEEKKVALYMKEMVKFINEIPKCLGVQAGYSMIFDEVKTIDDAINEAILMMMKNKE